MTVIWYGNLLGFLFTVLHKSPSHASEMESVDWSANYKNCFMTAKVRQNCRWVTDSNNVNTKHTKQTINVQCLICIPGLYNVDSGTP